jgi:septal ring factor EnvC (AmiA/AmiB activator)
MNCFRFYHPQFVVALLLSACLAVSFPVQAQGWRESLSSLWGRKSSNSEKAQQARAKAQAANARAHSARARLLGIQKTLLSANSTYFNYWHQMKRTEAQIVRERHRQHLVTERYNRRRILFGRRLAAMQRSGRLGYLQIFFGSRTLSDLTRRFYLFKALVARDAELQSELKADKAELELVNNRLMAQWHQRHKAQRAANRERVRVVNAEKEQRRALQQLLNSRNEMLAYVNEQASASKELDGMITQINSRRAAMLAAYQEEQRQEEARAAAREAAAEAEARRYSYSRRSRRSYEDSSSSRRSYSSRYTRNDDDDNNGSSRRSYQRTRYRSGYRRYSSTRRYRRPAQRYEQQMVARRVNRTHYVRDVGGSLKPMSISEIVFKAEKVPVPQSSGSLQEDRPARNDGGGDDFPASDPASP